MNVVDWRALDSTVLVIAVKRVEGTWCSYIKGVPGENHDRELEIVKKWGAKLPEHIALVLFPKFEGIPYAW